MLTPMERAGKSNGIVTVMTLIRLYPPYMNIDE